MKNGKLSVALAGMRFGGAFVPIYMKHPDVCDLTIVDTDKQKLNETGDMFEVARRAGSLDEVIADPSIDAVHLVTPIPLHAEQSVRVLQAGKHCACTVPAATSLEDLFALVKAAKESGKNYMMMETNVYTRQFIHFNNMHLRGEFGKIQLLRGSHYQDMENWPVYWNGLPPMFYATHAISPLLAITGTRAEKVHCFGSGTMREELHKQYNNPYPAETAIFRLHNHPAALEVTRTLFETARAYTEGFSIYGEKCTMEWNFDSEPRLHKLGSANPGSRGRPTVIEGISVPDYADLLPKEIGRFTEPGIYDDTNPQLSFKTGGGHHGSHPHMVHEFVRSIIEHRQPWINAVRAADWTAAGICAHMSAMRDGDGVTVPEFE